MDDRVNVNVVGNITRQQALELLQGLLQKLPDLLDLELEKGMEAYVLLQAIGQSITLMEQLEQSGKPKDFRSLQHLQRLEEEMLMLSFKIEALVGRLKSHIEDISTEVEFAEQDFRGKE